MRLIRVSVIVIIINAFVYGLVRVCMSNHKTPVDDRERAVIDLWRKRSFVFGHNPNLLAVDSPIQGVL